jgi:hypothetical protein
MPLPAPALRTNVGTWAVPAGRLPAVAAAMLQALPAEGFDPGFAGQELETTYFDTPDFRLRKARRKGDQYLTLRVRCYGGQGQGEAYALSAKTEAEKWRLPVEAGTAEALLAGQAVAGLLKALLPGHLFGRLLALAQGGSPGPVVAVCCRRYACEGAEDRLTLDCGVRTDAGKCLPLHVLEFKRTDPEAAPPGGLPGRPPLRPLKLSKFLWATTP